MKVQIKHRITIGDTVTFIYRTYTQVTHIALLPATGEIPERQYWITSADGVTYILSEADVIEMDVENEF